MPDHAGTFGPTRWAPGTDDGTWTKELLRSPGDSFSLLRLAAGATANTGSPDGRILVLEGDLSAAGTRHGRGAYLAVPDGPVTSDVGALAVVLDGERLGDPQDDVFDPSGWVESGPGLWIRLLLAVTLDEGFDERVVGLAHFEPGSFSSRHPHPTAHRFLFLDGEADDEVVLPDGARLTASRGKGDFVDYPHPAEHQTFSRTGCTILLAHEPLPSTS